MTRPLFAAPLALVACASLALVACGGAAPPPAASPEPPPPGFYNNQPREPSPVDREMLAIGHAEEEIDRAFPEASPPAGPRKGDRGPARPPPPADKPADGDGKSVAKKEEERLSARGVAGDPCAVACKALASMVSSADRLCQLAGDNDGRCDDARARVRGASARVKSSCPGCTVSTAPAATPKGTPAPEAPKGPAPGMPGAPSTQPIQ